MNQIKYIVFTTAMLSALCTGAGAITLFAPAETVAETPGPTTADNNAEAARFDKDAAALDTKAEQHARMAALYRALISGGSKQENTYRSLANHCDRLAELYRQAAIENREMAKSHRMMAQAT